MQSRRTGNHVRPHKRTRRRLGDASLVGLGIVVYGVVQLILGPRLSGLSFHATSSVSSTSSIQEVALLLHESFFSSPMRRLASSHDKEPSWQTTTKLHYAPDQSISVSSPIVKPVVIASATKTRSKGPVQHQKHQQIGKYMNMRMPAKQQRHQQQQSKHNPYAKNPQHQTSQSRSDMIVLSISNQQQQPQPKVMRKMASSDTAYQMAVVIGPRQEASHIGRTEKRRRTTRNTAHRNQAKQEQVQKQQNIYRLEDERHPIFYNLYIPHANYRTAILIAQEQMRQRELMTPRAPLYYTLIGYPNVTSKFCEPNCWQRSYLEQGHEVDTQQALWEYCQEAPDDEWVTYIHDKGSFHDNGNNKRARKLGTRAALACRKLLLNRDPSSHNWNVCGASFNILPQFQTNANMWTAKCSYVRELYEPLKYAHALEDMYNNTLLHPILGNTTYACLQPSTWRGSHVGLGRYSSERWVYSHPAVQPCSSLGWMNIGKATLDFTPRLIREPRIKPNSSPLKNHRFQNAFARLEGRLFEWEYLYDKKPPRDSWIWNYYKDYQTGTEDHLQECKAIADATRLALTNAGVPVPSY